METFQKLNRFNYIRVTLLKIIQFQESLFEKNLFKLLKLEKENRKAFSSLKIIHSA